MAKETKKQKKSEAEIIEEIRRLSERASKTTAKQLDIAGDDDIDPALSADIFKDTADPDKSHRLYYGIQRLLREHLPGGHSNKKLRQYIYNEKNLFLNRGIEVNQNTGTRGSDSRMTFISGFLEVAFNETGKWIAEGAIPFNIFQAFWDLNESRGYHKGNKKISKMDVLLNSVSRASESKMNEASE